MNGARSRQLHRMVKYVRKTEDNNISVASKPHLQKHNELMKSAHHLENRTAKQSRRILLR